jgi:hypothetical protein
VRKLYNYFRVLLLIMSRLLATTVLVQHHTLLEEGYDATSYLVGYGGSGHAYTLHLHFLRFISFEVLCWHELDMRSIIFIYMRSIVLFICGCGLFIVYHDLNFTMEILLD